MHEYSLTLQMIKIVEKYAKVNGASKVTKIMLVIGEDTGYFSESIQMYFNVLAKNTICSQAEIDIKWVKPMLKCTGCGRLFERKVDSFYCDLCGTIGQTTEIGKEFYIEFIEVED